MSKALDDNEKEYQKDSLAGELNICFINNKMASKKEKSIEKGKKSKTVYNKYNYKKRWQLIQRVFDGGEKVSNCAKELGICPTTARLIISTWESQRRVFEKKAERERRLKRQALQRANTQNGEEDSFNPHIESLEGEQDSENAPQEELIQIVENSALESGVNRPVVTAQKCVKSEGRQMTNIGNIVSYPSIVYFIYQPMYQMGPLPLINY